MITSIKTILHKNVMRIILVCVGNFQEYIFFVKDINDTCDIN